MDFNIYLRSSMLLPGVYNFYTRTFHINQRKRQLSYFCAIVSFIVSLKTLCIVLSPNPNTVFYLVHLYIAEGNVSFREYFIQRIFYVGAILIHAATGMAYLYWLFLIDDVSRIECFNFLFIPSLADLCKHYDLEKKLTQKFLRKADQIRFRIHLLIIGFELVFGLVLIRCLVLCYLKLGVYYFILLNLPLAIITFFSLHCLIVGILSMYCSIFTTQQFLKLRAEVVSKKILSFIVNQPPYAPSFKQMRLRKGKRILPSKIMATINSIVVQFNQANTIFDNLIRWATGERACVLAIPPTAGR